MRFLTDIEIARQADIQPITAIAQKFGIPDSSLSCYGEYKAKVSLERMEALEDLQEGHLILVTAINPTPAGEGKTTVTIGLGDALNRLGKKTVVALREPSLGPVFGIKGGATGGGYAQVIPMEDINLHFTGDFHAIGAAHNLLVALLDNHIFQGNELNIDPERIVLRRVIDMNDRQLRFIESGQGGGKNGLPRADGFDITVASELMAVFCLSRHLEELRQRIGRILVAYNRKGEPVYAQDLQAVGAMLVLLKEAFKPNLVQTLEGNPVFIHGGPFANIAHGCNSIVATKAALSLGDYAVTEAGFGADLGAEKFLNVKCRMHQLKPKVAVVVATVRALKYNGYVPKEALEKENLTALKAGIPNLLKHIENLKQFGLPTVVAINRFVSDTSEELALIREACAKNHVPVCLCEVWEKGGAGGEDLAKTVISMVEKEVSRFKPLYSLEQSIKDKVSTIATQLYGADHVDFTVQAQESIKKIEALGYAHLPICMAKTQYSLSDNPQLLGAPKGFVLTVREVVLNSGAGFLVVLTGHILRMPGLPKVPAAVHMDINENGEVIGLF